MIRGRVDDSLEAVVAVKVRDASGHVHEIEAVLDTGFNGSLTLPSALIRNLGLPWLTRGEGWLADGNETRFDVHSATIVWDGVPRQILVQSAGTDPLVGMGLLAGYGVWLEVRPDGDVRIEPLDGDAGTTGA